MLDFGKRIMYNIIMRIKRVFLIAGITAFCTMFLLSLLQMDFITILIAVLSVSIVLSGIIILLYNRKKSSYIFLCIILGSFILSSGLWGVRYSQYKKEQASLQTQDMEVTLILKDSGYKSTNGYYVYTAGIADGTHSQQIKLITDASLNCDVYDYVSGTFSFSMPEKEYVLSNMADSVILSTFKNSADLLITENTDKPIGIVFENLREFIRSTADKTILSGADFARALTIGDKQALAKSDKDILRDAGLSHIVAVSGAHISIFMACLSLFLRPVKNKYVQYGIFCFAAVFLMCLCAFSPSVVRACLMTVSVYIGNMFGRRADSLNSLGLVIFIMLCLNPFQAVSISFILSASATFGIILVYDRIYRFVVTKIFIYTNLLFSGFLEIILRAFCISLAATLFTSPAMLWAFGEINFTGILSNTICMPIIEIVFPLCIITILLGLILTPAFPLVQILGKITEYGVLVFMEISEFFSNIHISSAQLNSIAALIALGAGFVCYFIMMFIPKKQKNHKKSIIVPVCITLSLFTIGILVSAFSQNYAPEHGCIIGYVDVGQGMSSTIICDNKAVVIDCGGSDAGENTAEYLRQKGVHEIETIIVSHLHDDHANGVKDLCDAYAVKEIVIPFTEGDAALYIELMQAAKDECALLTVLQEDQVRDFYDVQINLLTEHLDAQSSDQNENSIVCVASIKKFSAMFTGDITEKAEKRLLQDYSDKLSVTVLGVPHHGSKYSSSQEFLDAVNPVMSVVSVGKNSYGHPDTDVLARLIKFGAVYRTDTQGTIEFITDGETLEVRTGK